MIKNIAKFFCMLPLILGVAGASIVKSSEATNPPSDELREQADDCIEKIREKQRKIQQEIELIKGMIKKRDQSPNPPKNPNR
jgi:sensor domain CHASE-containing protein